LKKILNIRKFKMKKLVYNLLLLDLKVADRHRSETEKGMDDLLFGSGAVRRPRGPPAEKPAEKPETKP
jgi:hypothetical protein